MNGGIKILLQGCIFCCLFCWLFCCLFLITLVLLQGVYCYRVWITEVNCTHFVHCRCLLHYSVLSSSPPHDTRAPSGPRPRYRGFMFTLTVGRTPLDEWSGRRRDFYLTTHNTHKSRHPCLRRDSNPQSQQTCGRRPTTGSVVCILFRLKNSCLPQARSAFSGRQDHCPLRLSHLWQNRCAVGDCMVFVFCVAAY
jgi:hypothetical protein